MEFDSIGNGCSKHPHEGIPEQRRPSFHGFHRGMKGSIFCKSEKAVATFAEAVSTDNASS
ncbi:MULTISPECIES: hypothetical protein [Aneurinibacillus]|uniref:Uncharacterized protein n=1 Tax=Aneurinibacillus thermoaerophilus TaxID=143495 RepID=A0ABX8YA19_ANETH|nr:MULTISPECIES: hypothetical protein [Aneurinibacillus]AMA72030.1 hypothetical protein ACH33_03680 [Aneurinibacillus sp. XH2]MED0679313.1 hypothetical protein [Aneurinibacillus thermoaerophilus]MED0737199.1 hypothetical protein [Aneurinibacillus thermoaerophilus]MED0766312.1 hypothetical protein [Aneurinibacillus thermoaerophilus]QYY42199.1 hypothetical protein K3F53_15235 [Aneurinibacillus thermoaerophilus]